VSSKLRIKIQNHKYMKIESKKLNLKLNKEIEMD
jgi:hypothetical protein